MEAEEDAAKATTTSEASAMETGAEATADDGDYDIADAIAAVEPVNEDLD